MKRKRKIKKYQYGKRKIVYIIVFIITVIGSIFLYCQVSVENMTASNQVFHYRAAIVDHLSSSLPNESFVEKAIAILENSNFIVDYYSTEEITVNFYRKLPLENYGIVLLRVHSALIKGHEGISLFTSEEFDENKYSYELLTDQLGKTSVNDSKGPFYFGITPNFVAYSMQGRFDNAIIIMMGCYGMTYKSMAEAFIGKGAKVYIGWNNLVDIHHTDTAAICLLDNLLIQKKTMSEAIICTVSEVGQDPATRGHLLCFGPISAKNFHVG